MNKGTIRKVQVSHFTYLYPVAGINITNEPIITVRITLFLNTVKLCPGKQGCLKYQSTVQTVYSTL